MKTLLLTLLMLVSTSALADEHIDIQGFHVGMRNIDFLSHIGDFAIHRTFLNKNKPALVLGGAEIHHTPGHGCKNQAGCSLLGQGTVDYMEFKFDAGQFDQIKAMVLEKYPEAKCDDSGCTYQTASEKLILESDELSVEAK